jgi:hypothetical protein
LHILRAQNGVEYRFYELTGDLSEALHFRHFEQNASVLVKPISERIRFKNEVQPVGDAPGHSAQGRVRLKDDLPRPAAAITKTAAAPVKLKNQKKDKSRSIKFSEPKSSPAAVVKESTSKQLLRVAARFSRGHVRVCKI